MSRVHELKCWPVPFDAVWNGIKPYEIRKNDRDYRTGDLLHLREWYPETASYSNRELRAQVMYMTPGGQWGLQPDVCVLGILTLTRWPPAPLIPQSRADAMVAEEREACAKAAERIAMSESRHSPNLADEVAAAIRAQKTEATK